MAAVACEPILKAAACFYKESKGIEENGDFLHKMFLLITTGVQTKQRVQICIDGNVFSFLSMFHFWAITTLKHSEICTIP